MVHVSHVLIGHSMEEVWFAGPIQLVLVPHPYSPHSHRLLMVGFLEIRLFWGETKHVLISTGRASGAVLEATGLKMLL